jgi:hypothetical protein
MGEHAHQALLLLSPRSPGSQGNAQRLAFAKHPRSLGTSTGRCFVCPEAPSLVFGDNIPVLVLRGPFSVPVGGRDGTKSLGGIGLSVVFSLFADVFVPTVERFHFSIQAMLACVK